MGWIAIAGIGLGAVALFWPKIQAFLKGMGVTAPNLPDLDLQERFQGLLGEKTCLDKAIDLVRCDTSNISEEHKKYIAEKVVPDLLMKEKPK